MFDVIKTGRIIKDIRNNKGMKQEECANKLGISRAALSSYENGSRTMDIDILYKFCALFDVSADYILGRAEIKTINPDIQTACKVTGLSEETINNLNEISKNNLFDYQDDLKRNDIINACFTQTMFNAVMDSIIQLIRDADVYKVTLNFKDKDKREKIQLRWSTAFVMSKYIANEAFKHLCDKLIEDFTGLSIDDLYNETITDLRYYRRDYIGEHNGKQE